MCSYFPLLSWFPHSSCLLFVNSDGNDGSDGGNGSGGNYDNYDDKEKAATPTVVTPTAMAMVVPMAMVAMTITATSRSGLRLFGTWTDRQLAQYIIIAMFVHM